MFTWHVHPFDYSAVSNSIPADFSPPKNAFAHCRIYFEQNAFLYGAGHRLPDPDRVGGVWVGMGGALLFDGPKQLQPGGQLRLRVGGFHGGGDEGDVISLGAHLVDEARADDVHVWGGGGHGHGGSEMQP